MATLVRRRRAATSIVISFRRWLCAGLVLAAFVLPPGNAVADDTVVVGAFSQANVSGWETRSFKGETVYALVRDPARNAIVLQATSNAAASGRFRKITIDLTRTPFMNWSWKVTHPLSGLDENAKTGDDFAARIYVVSEKGIMGMNSLSINYVWASKHSAGSHWTSPFTKQVRLVAVNSGSNGLNTWVSHKRNVRSDLRELFGQDITSIDAVALMTDTDNSGQRATAYYGDIWFGAE
ncbi:MULTISPECIES: DUF3047 domain-containing protein [unclassified Afipia]|nr:MULTISPECIES: DUF3047 domain-containing protein [unclassified Afipia]